MFMELQATTKSKNSSHVNFVQYAKVTLLEISPCQGPIVKRSGVAYSCSYALSVQAEYKAAESESVEDLNDEEEVVLSEKDLQLT